MCSSYGTWSPPEMSTTVEQALRSSGLRSNSPHLQVERSADFFPSFTLLLTRNVRPLHKSDLSPDIVVFGVAFLVICYVCQLSPPCDLVSPQAIFIATGATLAQT